MHTKSSLVPRLISPGLSPQAFIACSMKSDKSLGEKPGNEATLRVCVEVDAITSFDYVIHPL